MTDDNVHSHRYLWRQFPWEYRKQSYPSQVVLRKIKRQSANTNILALYLVQSIVYNCTAIFALACRVFPETSAIWLIIADGSTVLLSLIFSVTSSGLPRASLSWLPEALVFLYSTNLSQHTKYINGVLTCWIEAQSSEPIGLIVTLTVKFWFDHKFGEKLLGYLLNMVLISLAVILYTPTIWHYYKGKIWLCPESFENQFGHYGAKRNWCNVWINEQFWELFIHFSFSIGL